MEFHAAGFILKIMRKRLCRRASFGQPPPSTALGEDSVLRHGGDGEANQPVAAEKEAQSRTDRDPQE